MLVRKTEPKPVRVFLQDGSNDGLPGFLDEMGDSWMGNQAMLRALEFSGYDVRADLGNGGHDTVRAEEVLPDAMRWRPWACSTGITFETASQACMRCASPTRRPSPCTQS